MSNEDVVTVLHPLYKERMEQWKRCRDTIAGTDTVKKEGEKYLPAISGQSPAEYRAFQMRADLYAGAAHTHRSFMGMFFSREPIIGADIPEWLFFDSMDVLSFARHVCSELLKVGRIGMLLDYSSEANAEGVTRPYVASYASEAITNWKTIQIGEKKILKLVVLKEEVPKMNSGSDGEKIGQTFAHDTETVYRVLCLEPREEYGGVVYVQKIYTKKEVPTSGYGEYILSNEVVPTIKGNPLTFIPFYFAGVFDLNADPDVPPLLPVVDVNLSHYRTSASLEHGRHYAALPTAWVSGFQASGLQLGPENVWVSDDPQARAGFLELSGSGLAGLEKALEHKEHQMAMVGSRLLEKDRPGIESGDSLRVRKSGEQTIVSALGNNASKCIDEIIRQVFIFEQQEKKATEERPYFQLTVDNSPIDLPQNSLPALAAAVADGLISHQTYFNVLQKQGIIKATQTFESEIKDIDDNTERKMAIEQTKMNQQAQYGGDDGGQAHG